MPRGIPVDLTGEVFGKWTVQGKAGTNGSHSVLWVCACSCGSTGRVTTGNLLAGRSTQCGSCGSKQAQSKRWGEHRRKRKEGSHE